MYDTLLPSHRTLCLHLIKSTQSQQKLLCHYFSEGTSHELFRHKQFRSGEKDASTKVSVAYSLLFFTVLTYLVFCRDVEDLI